MINLPRATLAILPAFGLAYLLAAMAPLPAFAETYNVAVLQALDKVTARVSTFDAPVNAYQSGSKYAAKLPVKDAAVFRR